MLTQEKDSSEREDSLPEQGAHRPGEVTQLLLKWNEGDEDAFEQLAAIVDGELRRRAHHYLCRERQGHTIQTTALVDDVWMRLIGDYKVDWQSRAHFYAIAANLMRRVLVEEWRKQHAQKRGGNAEMDSLDDSVQITIPFDLNFMALDEALDWLKQRSPRKNQVVVLKFFGGMTIEEIAFVLKITPAAVKSDWESAKLLLLGRLTRMEACDE